MTLAAAVDRCVEVLLETAVLTWTEVTWPTWETDGEGTAARCRGGRSSLYDGDAGIAWALGRLGRATGNADAVELAGLALASLSRRPVPDGGLLTGAAGVVLATGGVPHAAVVPLTDLTSGVAGTLLALAAAEAELDAPHHLVEALWGRSRAELWGRSWTDPLTTGDPARPLCGLAHGASGVVWALAEAAARWPALADRAVPLVEEGLRWETTWLDPARGGWPDLRENRLSWPARWCHGAAGAGVVRARLLQLGLDGLCEDALRADLEVAVQACGAEVAAWTDAVAAHGPAALETGLTLCHGLGGPVGLLDLAADVLDAPEHRATAVAAAHAFLGAADADPQDWPSGVRGADGDLGLLNGLAGTALLLARLDGLDVPSPVLAAAGTRREVAVPA